jgi:hypothetical protein
MAGIPQIPLSADLATLPDLNPEDRIREDSEEDEAIESALGLESSEGDELEYEEQEDGSVVVSQREEEKAGRQEFYRNLAEDLDETELLLIANKYIELIENDMDARKKRDEQYEEGLRRTGMGNDSPGGATFNGASKVVHPVMAEACVDFAAAATREILPPDGVVKSNIKGKDTLEKEELAEKKVGFMNWQLDEQVPEYRDEMEVLLTQLPLGGSQYLKWMFNTDVRRPVCEWIPVDKMILPFAATNFYSASRATEIQDITEEEFEDRVVSGLYRDLEIISSPSLEPDETKAEKANDKIEGRTAPSQNIDGVRRVFHVITYLKLESDEESGNHRAPYLLFIDEHTSKVVGLYRNWDENDDTLQRLDWVVEYKFIPWRGAYAVGLPHLIGGLTAALTGALRALMDSAHINNIPTMLKLKGGRESGQTISIEPTQVAEIDAAPGIDDIRKIAMPMPFNPPSTTLFQLLGWLTDAAKGVVTTSEEKISEANSNMPVGTAQALIEQGAKVFSSIHMRLHRSQQKSLQILSRINSWHLDEMDNFSGYEVKPEDFDKSSDIQPVSDPHIFSESQRYAQNQAALQLAASAPQLYDLRALHKRSLVQMKYPGVDDILKPAVGKAKEMNPALENVSMSMGQPATAYPDQDHLAHIQAHLDYAQNPMLGSSPLIGPSFAPAVMAHLKEHVSLWYLSRMREYLRKANPSGGDFDIHEEHSHDATEQQAIAVASQLVAQDAQQAFAKAGPVIQQIVQQVQQMQQSMNSMPTDPNAKALLQAQQMDTQAKAQTAQAKLQLDAATKQAEQQHKLMQLQLQYQELQAKYQASQQDKELEFAKQIALADVNNASRERIEAAKLGAISDDTLIQLQHEQAMTAMQAEQDAQNALRDHSVQQQQQEVQAQQAIADRYHQARMQEQQHNAQQQQQLMDQAHAQELQARDHNMQMAQLRNQQETPSE